MGLAKAELHTEGGQVITCMFNPADITVGKGTTWQAGETKGGNAPKLRFQGGQSATIALSLVFDTSTDGDDVTTYTKKLLDLLKVDPSLPGSDADRNSARPPWVQLHWGPTHTFKAVVTKVQLKYTFFSSEGVPLRAKADVSLTQWEDEDAYPLQNPTSHTPRPHRVHVVTAGETLDRIAARYYSDATRWRGIAEANGVVDPFAVPSGSILVIPSAPVRHRG